ncbi:Putative cell survival pathways protein [Malassezia yamatoensis]|uniref:Cell survival pathways protein n=1 Tax=Malassezia yamatoensis TaxID=253288 RepID=A0AAJ6CGU6_9BASI|nr:Putative cell survival pathways protein [Malassezia yamatoensis]
MSSWSSWLTGTSQAQADQAKPAGTAGQGTNLHAVSDLHPQEALYGELAHNDLEWTCPSGLTTETQVWYTFLEDGAFVMSQIIYSSVGLWNPQVHMTFKYFHPTTGRKIWKSTKAEGFTPLDTDRRCTKSSAFNVTLKDLPDGEQEYMIQANLDKDVQLMYSMKRPAKAHGWKLGQGERGGFTYFGESVKTPAGYVVHRFWPYAVTSGMIVLDGAAIEAKGQGTFVHAIQGMRPNLVASRWNFCTFQSPEQDGVTAMIMEFTTTSDYGILHVNSDGSSSKRTPQTVTIGSLVHKGELISVVASTRDLDASSDAASRHSQTRIQHLDLTQDDFTGYKVPQAISYHWDGHTIQNKKAISADLRLELGEPAFTKGLVDKVDVMEEIPFFVKKLVNYVAGTKPYIYQTLNPGELTIKLPTADSEEQQVSTIKGIFFEEHTFISE